MSDSKKLSILTLTLGGALTVAAIIATALALTSGTGSRPTTHASASAAQIDRSHVKPAHMRTLIVYRGAMPPASAPGTVMNAMLLSGRMPSDAIVGTVMSDTQCTPDATGMSPCRNEVRMPGGHMMVVRHPHRMMDVACMTQGERVKVASS